MSAALFNEDDKPILSIKDIANLKKLAGHLNAVADECFRPPFDPKIAAILQMAADLAEEQVQMDKVYECYHQVQEEPDLSGAYKLLGQDDDVINRPKEQEDTVPTAEDLQRWFNNGGA